MDTSRWNEVQALFEAALAHTPAERVAFLEEVCAGDPDLFAEVTSLLEVDQQEHSLLDGLALDAFSGADDVLAFDLPPLEGQRVGPYRLGRRLGTGGMGDVYLAERIDGQFEQQVALKLIKRGMDSEQILHRFRSERQILARLQHPNIARLLDGGVTEDGLPYFVMEYVEGEPIDRYCDRHRLSIDARLQLFTTVCQAVRYAHANLVVHRDLKPANILVTDEGQVKLLDFGIAKVLGDNEEGAALTRTGGRVMTPAYASPEQVRGEVVGTSTDIYSLGVVLYELLTGRLPYAVEGAHPGDVERLIVTAEPEKPSTAVSRLDEQAATERIRATHGERLQRRLAGDLDMICLKALHKEPERRYASAEQLADDVQRHLSGLPIQARPDTAAYRLRKFTRRHRSGVLMTAIVGLVITALVGYYTVQLAAERDRAQREAATATEVARFLQDLFAVADPSEARGETITARQIVDRGAARIEVDLAGQPDVQARLLDVIGEVYMSLWLYDDAEALFEKAYDIRLRRYGPDHPSMVTSLLHVGEVHSEQGHYEAADSLYQAALAMRRSTSGSEGPEIAEILNGLGILYQRSGRYAEAEAAFLEAQALYERRGFAEDIEEMSAVLNNLGQLFLETGDYDRAEQYHARVLAIRRARYGTAHPDLATSLNNLGLVLMNQAKYEEARAILEENLAMARVLYGDEHPSTALSMLNLAALLKERERYAEAEVLQREAYEILVASLGPAHPRVAVSLNNLANLRHDQGDYEGAAALHERALALNRQIYGNDHAQVANSLNNLAALYLDMERYEQAEGVFREVLAIDRQAFEQAHPYIAMDLQSIGIALMERGRYAEAEGYLRQSIAMNREVLGEDHPNSVIARGELGRLLYRKGDYEAAEPVLREVIERHRAVQPDSSWRTAEVESLLGAVLVQRGHYAEAEPLLVRGHAILTATKGPDYRWTRRARARLVDLYETWERPAEAVQYRSVD